TSEPRWRILLADDLCGDERGRTRLACREVAADTGQHDRLSIGVFRGLHLPVRVLGHDLVRDPACGAEATNLLEVHVVQLLKEPRLLAFGELRQEVRHSRSLHAPELRRAHRELHDCGLANRSFSRRARDRVRPRLDPPCVRKNEIKLLFTTAVIMSSSPQPLILIVICPTSDRTMMLEAVNHAPSGSSVE